MNLNKLGHFVSAVIHIFYRKKIHNKENLIQKEGLQGPILNSGGKQPIEYSTNYDEFFFPSNEVEIGQPSSKPIPETLQERSQRNPANLSSWRS